MKNLFQQVALAALLAGLIGTARSQNLPATSVSFADPGTSVAIQNLESAIGVEDQILGDLSPDLAAYSVHQVKVFSGGQLAVTFDLMGNAVFNNTVAAPLVMAPEVDADHFVGTGGTPSLGIGTAGGVGATGGIAGTDSSGRIYFTAGTNPTNVGLFTVSFAQPYPPNHRPYAVILTPGNAAAAQIGGMCQIYVDTEAGAITEQAFLVNQAGGAFLYPGRQYVWFYEVK